MGSKALQFFKRLRLPIAASVTHLGDRPHVADFIGAVMLDDYTAGKIDRLFLLNAEFVNTMSQRPTVRQLLPAEPVKSSELQDLWEYLYEPSAAELLDSLLQRNGE